MLLLFWKATVVGPYSYPAYAVSINDDNNTEYRFSVSEGRGSYLPSERHSGTEYKTGKDGRTVP